MTVVVDASVAVRWYLKEEDWQIARRLLTEGYSLVAPDFLELEMASVLLRTMRRGFISPDDADEYRSHLRHQRITTAASTELLDAGWTVARRHGGSVYDAMYIALAAKLDAYLVSADAGMIRVATAAGVRCGLLTEGLPPPA